MGLTRLPDYNNGRLSAANTFLAYLQGACRRAPNTKKDGVEGIHRMQSCDYTVVLATTVIKRYMGLANAPAGAPSVSVSLRAVLYYTELPFPSIITQVSCLYRHGTGGCRVYHNFWIPYNGTEGFAKCYGVRYNAY